MSAKKLFLIFLLMLSIFFGTIWFIAYNDIGGVQKYARNIPLIGKLMPAPTDLKSVEEELMSYSNNKLLKYTLKLYQENEENKDDLVKAKKKLKSVDVKDSSGLEEKYMKISDELKETLDEVERLKEYEDAYVELKKERDKLNKLLALKDTSGYKQHYESIAPKEAKQIYELVLQKQQLDENFKNYLLSFSNMQPKKAALVIEQLMRTDFDVVLRVIENLDTEVSGNILSNLDTTYASMITKSIASKKIDVE